MISLIARLIVYPIIIYLGNYLSYNINYKVFFAPIVVGIVIAIVMHILETYCLKPGMVLINNSVDFIITVSLIYISQYIFKNSYITLLAASIVAIFLNIFEYIEHVYKLKNEGTK